MVHSTSLTRQKKLELCLKKYIRHRYRSSNSRSRRSSTSSSSSRSSSSSSTASESDSTTSSSFSSSSSVSMSSSSYESTSSSDTSTSSITLPDNMSTKLEKSVPKLLQSTSNDTITNNNLQISGCDESVNGLQIVFKPLKISWSGKSKQRNNVDEQISKGCCIYVGNLTNNVTKEHLQEIFSKYGTIKELHLPLDIFTKLSKGYSIIEYTTREEALKALLHMNGGQIDGYEINCKLL